MFRRVYGDKKSKNGTLAESGLKKSSPVPTLGPQYENVAGRNHSNSSGGHFLLDTLLAGSPGRKYRGQSLRTSKNFDGGKKGVEGLVGRFGARHE